MIKRVKLHIGDKNDNFYAISKFSIKVKALATLSKDEFILTVECKHWSDSDGDESNSSC